MLRFTKTHHYAHPTTRQPAHCELRIYDTAAGAVVILTEVADNPGISVTNTAEELATQLAAMYLLDPATTTWIEHYISGSYRAPRKDRQETFDAVSFTWRYGTASEPQWRRLTADELLRLLPGDAEQIVTLVEDPEDL